MHRSHRRARRWASGIIIALIGVAGVLAQERPQVAPPPAPGGDAPPGVVGGAPAEVMERRRLGPAAQDDRMIERVMEQMEQGRALDPFLEQWLQRYSERNLLRSPRMNAIDAAHYSAAELYLRRQRYDDCLARLRKVLDGKDAQDPVASLTHLNMAGVCRRLIGDVQQAIREYKLVQGPWTAYAQQQLLATLEETGQLDEAVAMLKRQYDQATERGEKLALLRRTAELFARNGQEDKAIEYYDRITKEFTAADLEQMVKEARAYVEERAQQVTDLLRQGRREEAEPIIREAEARLSTLRAQGRMEEAQVMQQAMDEVRRRFERADRIEREPARRPVQPRGDRAPQL